MYEGVWAPRTSGLIHLLRSNTDFKPRWAASSRAKSDTTQVELRSESRIRLRSGSGRSTGVVDLAALWSVASPTFFRRGAFAARGPESQLSSHRTSKRTDRFAALSLMARPGLEPSGRCPRPRLRGASTNCTSDAVTRITPGGLAHASPVTAQAMARLALEPSGRHPRSRHGRHKRKRWRDPDSNRPDDVPGRGTDAINANDGETRTRTGDTTIFSRVLYQLSYLALARRC